MRILFHDVTSSIPYDADLMGRQGIGGTEASVIRVAKGLSAMHDVVVAQRARLERVSPHPSLSYVPLHEPRPFGGPAPDCIVVLRKHRDVPALHARFPSASLISWIQNWQRPETVLLRVGLARSECTLVAASDAHRAQTDRLINGRMARLLGGLCGAGARIPVLRIYNPVDEHLAPDDTPVDPDKLVFFSNKGIDQVLAAFGAVRRSIPGMQLYAAGYSLEAAAKRSRRTAELLRQPGVHVLGRQTQRELFRHVREALCVFYPQSALSETFGMVYAESNALGTPVLAHDFGAAREILGSSDQLVDAADHAAIVARLLAWREGKRPTVSLRPEFRASSVVADWRRLLEGSTVQDATRDALTCGRTCR